MSMMIANWQLKRFKSKAIFLIKNEKGNQ